MLRTVATKDLPAVIDLVVAAGLFSREDAAFLDEALSADDATCLVEEAANDPGLASVVLYRPEEAADRAFDLTMIAVRPTCRAGVGALR